jgi:hypothetical protein
MDNERINQLLQQYAKADHERGFKEGFAEGRTEGRAELAQVLRPIAASLQTILERMEQDAPLRSPRVRQQNRRHRASKGTYTMPVRAALTALGPSHPDGVDVETIAAYLRQTGNPLENAGIRSGVRQLTVSGQVQRVGTGRYALSSAPMAEAAPPPPAGPSAPAASDMPAPVYPGIAAE